MVRPVAVEAGVAGYRIGHHHAHRVCDQKLRVQVSRPNQTLQQTAAHYGFPRNFKVSQGGWQPEKSPDVPTRAGSCA